MIPSCLTFSDIRYVSRVKWSNPGKGVAPSPTPRCCSYWKGSLLVSLDYGQQLYFYKSFVCTKFQCQTLLFDSYIWHYQGWPWSDGTLCSPKLKCWNLRSRHWLERLTLFQGCSQRNLQTLPTELQLFVITWY